MFTKFIKAGILLLSLALISPLSYAQEALCADVKIEILQELTMERQGFEALMRIDNTLDSFDLENVSVSVHFTDEAGNPVVATSDTTASDAEFFIRVDDTRNVAGLEMGPAGLVEHGSIAPQETGEIRWLIIPTADAAGQLEDGKLYYVGAQLNYSYGGKEEEVDVADDSIVVKPQPALTLDYFLTQEIVGDDAFTTEVEPPEPYTLGVRINNSGYGVARSVGIESAQPTIVENDLGLAVDFKILSSFLGGEPAKPDLRIDFGDIRPGGVVNGRWVMETNLSGEFTAFTASFTHADELGGELTSLLQATNAHFLKRDVLVDLPGRDDVRDFLAYAPTDGLYVFESEPTGLGDNYCQHCQPVVELDAQLSHQGEASDLTHDDEAGFSYARVNDPHDGSKVLDRVVRSDGKVMHPQNAWLSKERAADDINFNYYVNVFDNDSTGEYRLHWGEELADTPQAPVIRFIPNQVTYEGGSVGFLVQASDPNGTIPTLDVGSLPSGAEFVDQGEGGAVFEWNPMQGQAGVYRLTFKASDGDLETERSVHLVVHPSYDTDGDGMDDDWEREHFGDLSRDGTGDYSGDGRTDLQAFEEGLDPTQSVTIPGVPQIHSPIYDAEVLEGESEPYYPALSVTNSNHSDGIEAVEVLFEVYSDESMTEKVAVATVDEGQETTGVQLNSSHLVAEAAFANHSLYYWRARARDKQQPERTSAWVKSRFFISAEQAQPTEPQISSPAVDALVDTQSPRLAVTNSSVTGRSRLYYGFTLFHEADLETPVAETSGLAPGIDGETGWRVPKTLEENTGYLWRASVETDAGETAHSDWGFFLVSTSNSAPTEPTIVAPEPEAELQAGDIESGLTLTVANGSDPERQPLVYYFELDTVETFDSDNKRVSSPISEGAEQTGWTLEGLEAGQSYHWRVRANDGERNSDWVRATFSITEQPQTPPVPVLQNPVDGSLVEALKPTLEVNPVDYPDLERIAYRFELYAESGTAGFVAEHVTSGLQWPMAFELTDGDTYYWRARAEYDEDLVGAWSDMYHFEVSDPAQDQPPEFSFVLPDAAFEVDPGVTDSVLIQWVDSVPSGTAEVDLFYRDEAGTLGSIVSGIDANADGGDDQYEWNITQMAPGRYHLVAEITDEQATVTEEGCCEIVILESQCTNPEPEWVDVLDVVNLNSTNPRRNRRSPDATTEMWLDNPTSETIVGPVRLTLSNLTEAVTLSNADGMLGEDPYIYLLGEGEVLQPGETSNALTLHFAGGGESLFTFDPVLERYHEVDECP